MVSKITFAELESAKIESAIITQFEQITQRTLYAGNPERLFLEALAYLITLQNTIIDMAGKQNLLSFASKGHLDALSLLVGTKRLDNSKAIALQEFILEEALSFDVIIPQGTRVTTSDQVAVFVTKETRTLLAGEGRCEVIVEAMEAGSHLNGLVMGQINKMVDPVAYIVSTKNISMTTGGADIESDDSLRARAQLAPEAFTCAGPSESYRYHAMSVHQDISDVAVYSPEPGVVDIRIMMKEGLLPTEEILALVREKLNADDVRPLTDTVIVQAPEVVPYTIKVAWVLDRKNEALASSITENIEKAVQTFIAWQKKSPGRDINPTKLIAMLEEAGAKRVEVTEPVFRVLEAKEVAQEESVEIKFLGIESE